MSVDAILLDAADNVATLLRAAAAGDRLQVRSGADTLTVTVGEAIPMCHKICIRPIPAGAAVIKYGHSIGRAAQDVAAGQHVHVHNLRSARAGGEAGA